MAADENVDLVYVATPISEHCANVKMLLENGRNVLCEKAFAVNAREAREMTELAKEKGLLLAEAMWVRYMPMAKDAAGDHLFRRHWQTVYPNR